MNYPIDSNIFDDCPTTESPLCTIEKFPSFDASNSLSHSYYSADEETMFIDTSDLTDSNVSDSSDCSHNSADLIESDYAVRIDETPSTEPFEVYKDDDEDCSSTDQLDELTTTSDHSDTIKKKMSSMKSSYGKLRTKLNRYKSQSNDHCKQFQALNRAVLQMSYHATKLSALPNLKNVGSKIESYKAILNANSYDSNIQTIQRCIDLLHNPYQEFHSLNQAIDSFPTSDSANFAEKVNANLDQLRSFHAEYKQVKPSIIDDLDHCDMVIEELRRFVVRDVIDIIQELLAEDYDTTSVVKGYSQVFLYKSFNKLLSTIS